MLAQRDSRIQELEEDLHHSAPRLEEMRIEMQHLRDQVGGGAWNPLLEVGGLKRVGGSFA